MGDWRLPGYAEVSELGRGAQGRVVRARDERSGRTVAIKYLLAGSLLQESEALKEVRDRNVVRLYEFVDAPFGSALVLEFVDGRSLRELLAERGAMAPEAALAVLKGSLLGLAAAHRRKIVHRDYKPDNVLVTGDGTSKLADFGIAVRSGEHGPAGTPAYMAPEQWRGTVSPATDVYAATCVFFECVTGRQPYRTAARGGARTADLARQHQSAPVPVEEVPEAVRPLVVTGMAKEPELRPPGARAFAEELELLATGAYGPDWEARGLAALTVSAAALGVAAVAGAQSAGGAATAKTTLASVLAGKGALVVAGTALLAVAGTATFVVLGRSADEPKPPPPAAAAPPFTVGTIDITDAVPAAGRADIQLVATGVPQVSGGGKPERDAVNALLRAPVDKVIAQAKAALGNRTDLAKPGCEGVGLKMTVVRGVRTPRLVSVGYEFVQGYECASESFASAVSVTVDVGKAAAISQRALFKPAAIPLLGRRLSWPAPSLPGSCADMRRLAPADLDPPAKTYRPTRVMIVLTRTGLQITKTSPEFGCDVTGTSLSYAKAADLLRPEILALTRAS